MVFTFVIKVNLNKPAGLRKGRNEWEAIVYRTGETFEEALQKVNSDFDSPYITFACEGEHKPLRGLILEEIAPFLGITRR